MSLSQGPCSFFSFFLFSHSLPLAFSLCTVTAVWLSAHATVLLFQSRETISRWHQRYRSRFTLSMWLAASKFLMRSNFAVFTIADVFERNAQRALLRLRDIGKERNEESECDSWSLGLTEFTPSSWLLPKVFPFQFDRITQRRSRRWVSAWQAPVSCRYHGKMVLQYRFTVTF